MRDEDRLSNKKTYSIIWAMEVDLSSYVMIDNDDWWLMIDDDDDNDLVSIPDFIQPTNLFLFASQALSILRDIIVLIPVWFSLPSPPFSIDWEMSMMSRIQLHRVFQSFLLVKNILWSSIPVYPLFHRFHLRLIYPPVFFHHPHHSLSLTIINYHYYRLSPLTIITIDYHRCLRSSYSFLVQTLCSAEMYGLQTDRGESWNNFSSAPEKELFISRQRTLDWLMGLSRAYDVGTEWYFHNHFHNHFHSFLF